MGSASTTRSRPRPCTASRGPGACCSPDSWPSPRTSWRCTRGTASAGRSTPSGGTGKLLGANIVGILAIFAWTCATVGAVFMGLKSANLLRISVEEEEAGIDISHHGGSSYTTDYQEDAAKGGKAV